MWVEDYQWHYDYVRLAWDTGFSFEKCKSPNLDKNKICVVDVDRIVKERDVASVDRFIPTVVQYILEDEQAKVLDTNFVKIFRISQLAVEYLLFCKKYLDNTVVLLKKELAKYREENKGLKDFVEDLERHVETLTKQQLFATFKCSICSKVFSSEEYLNAHIKRRHDNQNTESFNSETDKLNLEIKELKERLNNTEKLLKEKDEQNPEKTLPSFNADNSKVTEVLEKFEDFKNHMDNELKELKIQKSFYEENYGKLFDIVIQNKENIEPKNHINEVPKTETTTQTDKLLHIENVNNKNVVEIQEPICGSNSENKIEEVDFNKIVKPQTEKESIETKISTTLAGIEDQMQAFWSKLNEIEQNKTTGIQSTLPDEIEDNLAVQIKPKAKPRSKLSHPTHNTRKLSNNTEKLKTAIDELEQQQKEEQLKIMASQERYIPEEKTFISTESHFVNSSNADHQSETESYSQSDYNESESDTEESVQKNDVLSNISGKHIRQTRSPERNLETTKLKEKIILKPPLTSVAKHSHSSLKKTNANKTILNINKEIKVMLCDRLHELGISENWTRLPEKTFARALEIINHQATVTKKAYPNYNNIKKKINNDIEKQYHKKVNNKTQAEKVSVTPNVNKSQNIVKVSYRPKSGKKSIDQRHRVLSPKRETVEIKNRALYETDTESEQNFKQSHNKKTPTSGNMKDSHRWYSNVVDELKSLPNVKSHSDEDSMDELNKDAQKGVLKSFPSVGSLSKKKVLFDLESESNKMEDAPVGQKTGGSTTSIASSILGEKIETTKVEENAKEKLTIKNLEKDLDDLSDFDLSDL